MLENRFYIPGLSASIFVLVSDESKNTRTSERAKKLDPNGIIDLPINPCIVNLFEYELLLPASANQNLKEGSDSVRFFGRVRDPLQKSPVIADARDSIASS